MSTEPFIEFLKINHANSENKLNRDVLELIFEKYILSLTNNNTYCIDNFEKPNLYIIKVLYKNGYKCSSQTTINAVKNNNISVLNWLLENKINIGYAMKYAFINGNLEIIKLLLNNKINMSKDYILDALINNHYHVLDYLTMNNYRFDYKYLLLEHIDYNQTLWVLSRYKNIELSIRDKRNLILNAIKKDNLDLLYLLKDHKLCVYSFEIILKSLNNFELIKFFDNHIDEIIFDDSYYIRDVNIITRVFMTNNIDIIKYYFYSNKETSIFKIFDNDITNYNLDLLGFILNDNVIKYIYSDEKCVVKLDKYYLITNIFTTNNISLLEWLYNNKYISFDINMIRHFENNNIHFFGRNYDINKYIIDNIYYSDYDKRELIHYACRFIERGNIHILELLHNKIMTFEEIFIMIWEERHYDYLDIAYKYRFFDVVRYMRNKDIWTKDNVCYLKPL